MRNFGYQRATSVDQAVKAHASKQASFVAGGTTLLDLVKLDVMRPYLNRLIREGRTGVAAIMYVALVAWVDEPAPADRLPVSVSP